MRIHKDDKPLACPHCDFRARQRHALNYHLSRNHKDVVEAQNDADDSAKAGTAAPNVVESTDMGLTTSEDIVSGICTSEAIG